LYFFAFVKLEFKVDHCVIWKIGQADHLVFCQMKVAGNYLTRELRADIDTAQIGCLGSKGMCYPPVMLHLFMPEVG